MSMEPILSEVYLDVYDHDTTPTTIKAIALDSQTRFVQAYLQKYGEVYQPDLTATVSLIALRPDNVGVEGTGSIVELVPENRYTVTVTPVDGETTGDSVEENGEITEPIESSTSNPVVTTEEIVEPAIYGVKAEITQAMLAVEGVVLLQFRLTVGDEVLRTEIFKINNGKALDGSTSEWADEYQGYNLDELVEKVDLIGEIVKQVATGEMSIDQAVLDTHLYIDRKIDERLSVHDNGIYIRS